jgi:hypothetical protein
MIVLGEIKRLVLGEGLIVGGEAYIRRSDYAKWLAMTFLREK